MAVVEEKVLALEGKMEQVGTSLARMETILASLDQKVDRLDQRIDKLDMRIDRLDDRAVKLFLWVIGIQMTTLITMAAGLFAMVARLIPNP